jgi:ATP synthase F1 gamma subunit
VIDELKKAKNKIEKINKSAVIVITSNQGLCGKFNAEIFKRLEGHVLNDSKDADIFMVGKKGQEHYLTNKKYNFKFYPYNLPDNFTYTDLLRLVEMFPIYTKIVLVYSRYINTINRDVAESLLVMPAIKNTEDENLNLEI